jgi:hypothetical protein
LCAFVATVSKGRARFGTGDVARRSDSMLFLLLFGRPSDFLTLFLDQRDEARPVDPDPA